MSDAAPEHACAPPAKTLIVGSRGRMGSLFSRRGARANLNVAGVDLPYEDLDAACRGVSLALVCVPAKFFEEVVARIVPHLPPAAILADITSVKETPLRQMEKLWPGEVVGTHPLFGPGAREDEDLPVALTPGENTSSAALGTVAAFFQKMGCRVFETTAEKHDRAMARIQNLNFVTNLAYFAALAGQEDLLPFLTPSFERRKKSAAKMLTEDAEMFAGLFDANPHSHEAARQYRKMLNAAAAGDIELLCQRARWWWPDQKRTPPR